MGDLAEFVEADEPGEGVVHDRGQVLPQGCPDSRQTSCRTSSAS